MPSWKKVLISGSDAALNTLNITTALTASGLIYPASDGTSGQGIVTDGNGNLSFTSTFPTASFVTASNVYGPVGANSVLTASYSLTSSYNVNLLASGSSVFEGSLRIDPTLDPNPSGNLFTSSSYLFVSSSNNSLGYDLYVRQNGNLVKWKWVEGLLSTGVLYGGNVTFSGDTVYVSSGSGIIVDHNASNTQEITPTVNYVQWNNVSQSITNIATEQVTYLYMDLTGSINQQNTPFTVEQYHDTLPLGAVGHFDYSSIVAYAGAKTTAYDQVSQTNTFIDAFGPLKLSGYSITPQPGSLKVTIGSGETFMHGGFYANNPELPSNYTSPAAVTASLARVYRSGSGVYFDTNNNNFYTDVDPGHYDDGSGTLQSVPGGSYTIKRIFTDPRTNNLYIYYGQNVYGTLANAYQSLASDSFIEGEATQKFTTFVAYLIIKAGTTNLASADAKFVTAGLFRNTAGGSSGGAPATYLDDLIDVTLSTPANGQALVYNSGVWSNGVPKSATSSSYTTYAVNADKLDNLNSTQFLRSDQSGTLTGDLTVTGIITAQEFHTEFVSASIIYQSGSTQFGNSADDTHIFSGSVNIDGAVIADSFTGIFVGALSSSAQIATDISGAFTALSSSFEQRIAPLEVSVSSLNAATSSYALESNISGAFTSVSSSIATDISNIIDGTTTVTSASYALTASYIIGGAGGSTFPYQGDAVITGSLLISGSFVDFTQVSAISGSIFSGSFVGDGSGLSGLGYGDTKKLNQTVAATTWSFSHNMNEQYPTVTVYNANNEVIQPSKIEGVDAQTLKLYFSVPVAGTAVAVVGGVATTQEAGFNRVFTQTSTATTWSFVHNLGNKYPQIAVYDSNDELIIPGKVEAIDQNNAILYFDTPLAGTATATVGGTSLTASYAEALSINNTALSTQQNTDVDTGIETVATVSTLIHTGAFFDYVLNDGTNFRAGTVMSIWDGSSVQYTDNSTTDIGDTSGVVLSVDISGTDARLRATVATDNWTIKAFVRAL